MKITSKIPIAFLKVLNEAVDKIQDDGVLIPPVPMEGDDGYTISAEKIGNDVMIIVDGKLDLSSLALNKPTN